MSFLHTTIGQDGFAAAEVPLHPTTTERVNGPPEKFTEDGISVVIPAFNEENGIAVILERLLKLLLEFDPALCTEVIVVDDGSHDGTAAAIEPFEGELVQVVRHPQNRGYGAALKTGIRHARYNWILIIDADGTYPEESIPGLLQHRVDNEMVVGARTGPNAQIPLLRRGPKWVLRKLASHLANRKIPDLNSGLRLIHKDAVERFENLLPNGFSFTTTITLAMLSSGYNVKYVPIEYKKRTGRSKIRPIADTLNFLTLIFRTIMFFDPLRVFIPAAIGCIALSVIVGVGSIVVFGRLMDVTMVLLFVSGLQFFGLGLIADMVNRRYLEKPQTAQVQHITAMRRREEIGIIDPAPAGLEH